MSAYLFEGNKLIAASTNGWGRHAEIGLLPFLRRDRQQRVYVKRISDCKFMSRPCARCTASLLHVSPKIRVFFTNENGDWIEDKEMNSTHKSRRDYGQPSVNLRLKHHRNKSRKKYLST